MEAIGWKEIHFLRAGWLLMKAKLFPANQNIEIIESDCIYQNRIQKNVILMKSTRFLHTIILRGMVPKEAGHYRTVAITIKIKALILVNPQLFQRNETLLIGMN
jgi:hypothetical protein